MLEEEELLLGLLGRVAGREGEEGERGFWATKGGVGAEKDWGGRACWNANCCCCCCCCCCIGKP